MVGAIVQARMTSTRLPGKVAKELPYGGGVTVLEQVVRRLRKCRLVDKVVVATTTDRSDAPLVRLAAKAGAGFFRGSMEDVLSRYYLAAKKYGFDTVVRITSDCPCVDPGLVDALVKRHVEVGADYTSNVVKLTYPDGFDVEVFSFAALETAHAEASIISDREHVTSYLRGHPERFKVASYEAPPDFARPELRVTLDTEEDYALICAVYDALYQSKKHFGIEDVFRLFKSKPWLEAINRRCVAKKVINSEKAELREAIKVLKLQELGRAADIISARLRKVR